MNTKIVIRVDALEDMGLGHLIRCIALADMVKEHFDCTFVIRVDSLPASTLIETAGHSYLTIPIISNIAEEALWMNNRILTGNEIVLLDGYQFTEEYQDIIKYKAGKLVYVDDLYAHRFRADVVINHAGNARMDKYHTSFYTRLCLGTDFALLRSPFLEAAKLKRSLGKITAAFICMGGMDTANQIIPVIKNLGNRLPDLKECTIVTSKQYAHKVPLEKIISNSEIKLVHLQNLSASALVEVMQKSQIGICTPSGVAYEYASVGGGLFLIQTADNQKGIMDFLLEKNAADLFINLNQSYKIENHLKNQRSLFDGRANERYLSIFQQLEKEIALEFRLANTADLMTYFHWANDRVVRENALQTSAILLNDHAPWFNKKLNDPSAHMLLFEYEGITIGQVRFDIVDRVATIGYSVDENWRGKGFGTIMLKKALVYLSLIDEADIAEGLVKMQNESSSRIFRRLNFKQVDPTSILEDSCYLFQLQLKHSPLSVGHFDSTSATHQ